MMDLAGNRPLLDRDDVARRRHLLRRPLRGRHEPRDDERELMRETRRKTASQNVNEQREEQSEREQPTVVARTVGGREHEIS
jgi:hypothetical protein